MSFDPMNESLYDVIKHGDIEDLAKILGALFPCCWDCPLDISCEKGCVDTWKDFLNMSFNDFWRMVRYILSKGAWKGGANE